MSKHTQIAVLGTPVRDAYLDVDTIAFPEQRVVFSKGAECFDLAYQGEPMRFGEKRYAHTDLSALNLARFTVRNGGGAYHTGMQMARLCRQNQAPIAFSTVDLTTAWPELAAAYTEQGIKRLSLGLEQPTTNLVLTNGKPDRLILKSPVAPTPLHGEQATRLRRLLPQQIDLLIINSLVSADLARVVSDHARLAGAAQYSVLTPSLALEARIELQLRRDRASVCNLSEFSQIAQAFGIACPPHEESAPLPEVTQAMTQLARHTKIGDLVVTLGARGCLTRERVTGALHHVALHPTYWQSVQTQIRAHPERKNGVGDRFFGTFVLAHAFARRGIQQRVAYAARWSSVEMARQLAPDLTPTPAWVAVQSLPMPISRGHQPQRNALIATGHKLLVGHRHQWPLR